MDQILESQHLTEHGKLPCPSTFHPFTMQLDNARIALIGLRYFNVVGPRQNPNGAYAAVIPKWTDALLKGEPVFINGDGETSRDFCFVANAVQADLLTATVSDESVIARCEATRQSMPSTPTYRNLRPGDVLHSQTDISKAGRLLGYEPTHRIGDGIAMAMP